MADRLPWFPLYVNDFLDDPDVHQLTYEQIGIYFWCLCRQWQFGGLPAQPPQALRHMLPDTNSAALALILHRFFPLDPDSDKRVNPKLQTVRTEQEASIEAKRKGGQAAKGNLIPGARYRRSLGIADSPAHSIAQNSLSANQMQSQKQKADVVGSPPPTRGIPNQLLRAGEPFWRDPATRQARLGELQMFLGGMRGRVYPLAVIERALIQMTEKVKAEKYTLHTLRKFCPGAQDSLEQEAAETGADKALGKPPVDPLEEPM